MQKRQASHAAGQTHPNPQFPLLRLNKFTVLVIRGIEKPDENSKSYHKHPERGY